MTFKCIEFPGREFASKEAMFAELKKNEAKIIGLKKAQIYEAHKKAQVSFLSLDTSKVSAAVKASFGIEEGFIYPVISTTRYRDSHKDVHFDGCFAKTVKEQQGKIMYILDHKLEFDKIIAWPKGVEMFVSPLDWSLVGKNYYGQTEALIFKIAEKDIEIPKVLQAIKNKIADFENSIRMVYYKIKLAVNSNNKEMADNKAYYDQRINEIANKAEVEEDGYFWGVEELGIHKEGSLVVAGGSNDATAILFTEELSNPSEDSSKSNIVTDPDPSSQKVSKSFYQLIGKQKS